MAPQLTGRKGCLRRRLRSWMFCAASFLARARFADQQDGGFGRRHAADLVVQRLHRRRIAEHLAEQAQPPQLAAQVADLGLEVAGRGMRARMDFRRWKLTGLTR